MHIIEICKVIVDNDGETRHISEIVANKTKFQYHNLSMKTNEYNIDDFYFNDHDGVKLNPDGMSLICYYYRKKHGLNNLFAAANYRELENIIKTLLDKVGDGRFGIVYRNIPYPGIGFSHKCAVIIQGNKVIILDPFGGSGGINFARMGADYIKLILIKLGRSDVKTYIPRLRVQSDFSSCSTLCFLFLKEALRMGDELINFLSSADAADEEDDLPPSLAKYTQKTLYLYNSKDSGLLNKYPDHNHYQIPIRSNRRQSEVGIKTETLWQYVQSHQKHQSSDVNPVATDRAAKHIQIINEYLKKLTSSELETILQETRNPTEEELSINEFRSIDDLIRINGSKKNKKLSLDCDEQDGLDVFSLLEDDARSGAYCKLA